ncbi:MFS family permease [Streptomyces turgidiscabies]|uniref:MFS family permease n=1 Tax=Streptomyces turgidiscabies TaxID=85558 RepID=A0ABU0RY28_9ACTN|nr:MFS transporter [Streptomyces turgidiscabies]MDQ0936753.1 MFS family permease [Streptomyces turgidiscabies]
MAVGLIIGGLLTDWLTWRSVFFVNVPIGLLILVLAPLYIRQPERHPGRFDLPGALTSTLGMGALVYRFIRASEQGWGDGLVLGSFAAAVILLAAFLAIETRAEQPITPLKLPSPSSASAWWRGPSCPGSEPNHCSWPVVCWSPPASSG